MQRIILIILLFSFYLTKAQVKNSEAEMRTKADEYILEYNEKYFTADTLNIKRNAYESFSSLVSNFPKSEYFTYYLYNKGGFSSSKEEAKKCFQQVIQANNYKYYVRKSYIILTAFAIDDKDYKKAGEYLDEIKKLGDPYFTCGNELESDKAQLKNLYRRYESGKNKGK